MPRRFAPLRGIFERLLFITFILVRFSYRCHSCLQGRESPNAVRQCARHRERILMSVASSSRIMNGITALKCGYPRFHYISPRIVS